MDPTWRIPDYDYPPTDEDIQHELDDWLGELHYQEGQYDDWYSWQSLVMLIDREA